MAGVLKHVIGGAIGLSLAAAAPAAAESWRVTGVGGEAPDRSVYLVDTDSIWRNGDKVRFKSMTIWEMAENDTDRSITDRAADCKTRLASIEKNRFYLGSELQSEDGETKPAEAKAETMIGDVLDAVCGRLDYSSEAVADPVPAIRSWLSETEDL